MLSVAIPDRTTLTVDGSAAYPVVVGTALLDDLPELIGTGARQVLVVHAAPVAGLVERVASTLESAGLCVVRAQVPDGEAAKSAEVAAGLWSRLGQADFTRSDVVVGVGGGAVTDLAGFVAATWLRGVRVVQVPTSLLGMVDAAVGGKTGINTAEGKNLVGCFHPPAAVLCDLSSLVSLPAAEVRSGLAEIIKCGFIADPMILQLVEEHPVEAGSDVLRELVERAIQVKADVVGEDLTEAWLREILNYGHTLGHAIELHEQFSWRHGEAISVGMVFAAELAQLAGRLDATAVQRHRDVLAAVGLPTRYHGAFDDLLAAMRRDKKSRGATLRFVVLDGIARPTRLEGPDPAMLRAAFERIAD
jgi:3-dehydroquinate synthase